MSSSRRPSKPGSTSQTFTARARMPSVESRMIVANSRNQAVLKSPAKMAKTAQTPSGALSAV
jgi:hypothetical protein